MSAVGPVQPAHEEVAVLAGAVREGDLSAEQREALAVLLEVVAVAVRRTWDPLARTEDGPDLVMGWPPIASAIGALLAGVGQ